MSFGGQKFDDSPKALSDEIVKDEYFNDYKKIWAFTNPDSYDIPEVEKVKTDTLKFYVTALSAKFWIDNSSVERGLKLKRKSTVEINTWHGTPLKRMGNDINTGKKRKRKKHVGKTIICSQSEFDREIFSKLFAEEKDNIILSDLPRNDFLTKYDGGLINAIKEKLNIPLEKKVILYAPTFREYDRDKLNACYIAPPINLDKWEKTLGDKYVLLFRAHYEVINVMGIKDGEFVKNVSKYPSLNELMIISDLLISDYSSIYFDFSILLRPMYNFSYDLEEYREKRGFYEDVFSALPCRINENEDSLLEDIVNTDYESAVAKTKQFKERFAPYAGKSCEKVIGILKKETVVK